MSNAAITLKTKDKLKRNVSGFNAYTMVVGTIIGTGIFFKPQAVFKATGSATLGLAAWVIGCFLGLCGGLIIAEIGSLIPETGGLMTYLEKIYSKVVGFMVGWSQTVAFYPIRVAAAAVVFGMQTVALFHWSTKLTIPIAILLTLWLFTINVMGNAISSFFINLTTFLKFIPMILIVVFAFFFNGSPNPIAWTPVVSPDHPLLQGLSVSVIATLYATDGWINITDIAGEIKNPQKNIPKAIIGGILTVTITYLLINLAYLSAMTPDQMAVNGTVGSTAAGILMGPIGQKVVAVGILISTMGSQAGFTRTAWRVPYALSLRNWLPFSGWFSKVTKKNHMPINSGIYMTAFTIVAIVVLRDFNTLTDIGTFTIWLFYTLTFIGLFILRHKWPDAKRTYKVPMYPVIPVIGVLSGIFVLVSNIVYQPKIALLSIGLIVLGLPIYYYKHYKASKISNDCHAEAADI